jgi:pilus assembly protein Flp/PilA
MQNVIGRFMRDESGTTAIEYGLIAACISVAIVVIVKQLGSTLNTKYTDIDTKINQ